MDDDIKRILVVSRMTKYCQKAVHYGISLSRKYGAELYVIHVIHNQLLKNPKVTKGAWTNSSLTVVFTTLMRKNEYAYANRSKC